MEQFDKIKEMKIEDRVNQSFLDYSMSVITSRALPDVRDGLKPVHRRILYSMWEQRMLSHAGHYKSARIVGDVIGKYHPHGDLSVYEALVRMAQPWSLMTRLADGQGNFGSMDGDPAAAMRYTEAKMTKISEELMKGIEKDSVDFRDNYDGRNKEPVVLPAKFPNLLVNGVQGIAVGMASNIPTHNLGEVCDATINLINNPDLTTEELLKVLPGPDFPTGGQILGNDGIVKAFETGKGSFTMRGSVVVEDNGEGLSIVITQIPYQVNKSVLQAKIRDIQKTYDEYRRSARSRRGKRFTSEMPRKALNFIKRDGLNDESDSRSTEDSIRIVIDLIEGVDPNVVINHLYKYTPLQTSFAYNNTVLIPDEKGNLKPKCVGIKKIIEEYVKHQKEVLRRELNHDLRETREKIHFSEAMQKALKVLDDVLDLIRKANSNEEALDGLMKMLKIDKKQASFILDKQIRTLTGAQQKETAEKHKELKDTELKLEKALSDENEINKMIVDTLTTIKENFGRERRTELRPPAEELTEEHLIQNERVVVTISNNGYIKSTKEEVYKNQRRNGRGIKAMNLDDDDFILHLEIMYNHDNLLMFTNLGKVYKLRGFEIPMTSNANKGFHLHNLLPGMEENEIIQSVISVKVFTDKQCLMFTTKNGLVKKTVLSEYENIHRNGIKSINLDNNDSLVNVVLTDGNADVILVTKEGKSITFTEKEVRPTGRDTRGVIGIKLSEKDEVISSDLRESFGDLFVITENGYGKRTDLSRFRTQKRGGSGLIALKVTKKTGKVVSTLTLTDDDFVFILSSLGSLIKVKSSEVSKFDRMAMGTRLINLKEKDHVKSAARLSETEEEEIDALETEEVN